jgi:hypothetical protein
MIREGEKEVIELTIRAAAVAVAAAAIIAAATIWAAVKAVTKE